MQPGQQPHRYPLTRHEAEVAEQMVKRAAELPRDSHAHTRHAAVLVKDGSLLAWGTNGVQFRGEDHCYCKAGEFGHHDHAGPMPSSGRSRWRAKVTARRRLCLGDLIAAHAGVHPERYRCINIRTADRALGYDHVGQPREGR